MTEDKMAGRRHRCNGRELGQTLGDGEGQGSLACCSPWGHKELDTTWQLNNKMRHRKIAIRIIYIKLIADLKLLDSEELNYKIC